MSLISKIVNLFSPTAQKSAADGNKMCVTSPIMRARARQAAAEGIVLVKNDGTLPIKSGEEVSVFGRTQYDWFCVGYGSGGDVKAPYKVSFADGLKNKSGIKINENLDKKYSEWCKQNVPDEGFWGHWPFSFKEMPISENEIWDAAKTSDVAIITIGRAAGEDREQKLKDGSFYLTLDELKLIDEDVFVGYRYFETFAKDEVIYPFGYGLSYTTFETKGSVERTQDGVRVVVTIKNTGDVKGKTVAQVYVRKADGMLPKPARELVAYAKTEELESGEVTSFSFDISEYALSSYDDEGATGYKACWVLEYGDYEFFVGENVRDAQSIGIVQFDKKVTSVCHTACSPSKDIGALFKYDTLDADMLKRADVTGRETFEEFMAKMNKLSEDELENFLSNLENGMQSYGWKYHIVKGESGYLKERIESNMPKEIAHSDEKIDFKDVVDGKRSIDEFVATLSDEDLENLCHGDYRMNSPKGAAGNAGVFGGISESLAEKGVPTATTTDGPSGIRLCAKASLLPCGTCIASTWNEQLAEQLYECVGDEMIEKGSDVLLAPGMNIHRSMLCGRNFEYFSEDPYLSGKTASAIVKGVQSRGVGSCVKHFACNNQERFRYVNDSRLTERALREIYLKGFEICVKEAKPLCVMTSYNKVNGVYSYHNYDLCTTILRDEWGFENMVMTDWWTKKAKNPLFKGVDDNAYRVRAQVDVLMPGGSRLGGKYDGSTLKSLNKGGLQRAELQRTAKNVLSVLKKLEINRIERGDTL